MMTTLQSCLIAAAIFGITFYPAMYCCERAGIPAYGYNPDQKPGWTILYIIFLLPCALSFAWLAGIALVGIAN